MTLILRGYSGAPLANLLMAYAAEHQVRPLVGLAIHRANAQPVAPVAGGQEGAQVAVTSEKLQYQVA